MTARASVLLALIAVAIGCCMRDANAKLCVESLSSAIWKHNDGSFKKVGPKTWREFNGKNEPNAETFEEVLKEGTSIVIHDKARDVQVLLKEDVAGIKQGGDIGGNFNQLYQGGFLKVMDCT